MPGESSKRDDNYVTSILGVDMSTGLLPTKVYVDEITHRLLVSAVITSGVSLDTELPAATVLADNTANPTTTGVASYPHWYDGVTWDRARGDSTDGLLVNLGANNDVTVTGTVTANAGTNLNTSTLALSATQTDKSQFTKLTDGTDTALVTAAGEQNVLASAQPGVDIGDVTVNNATGASAVNIQDGGNSLTVDYGTTGSGTATGALRVELPTNGTGTVGLNAGTNAIGKLAANSGVDIGDTDVTSVVPGTTATNLGKAVDSAGGATDTGVASLQIRDDVLTTVTPVDGDYMPDRGDQYGNKWVRMGAVEVGTPFNAVENDVDVSLKASAGYLKTVAVSNYNAAKRYFQIHNKATAPANPDVPVFSFPIPAGTANNPGTLILDQTLFGEGGYACTVGVAIGVSTTALTFTAATTTEHVIAGMYI